jgi:PAS domain-containing protein
VAQKPVEVILTRQLASCLAMPAFLVDPEGNLIYYNEPAESLLGLRYEDTGEMAMTDWVRMFRASRADGSLVPAEAQPLVIAVREGRPAHDSFWIQALDGVRRRLATTAVPIEGQGKRVVGALALFWEEG